MGLLDGKTVIITGGATGIGRGIARIYAREGATLVLASRNRDNLETTAAEFRLHFGASVIVVPTDVTVEVSPLPSRDSPRRHIQRVRQG